MGFLGADDTLEHHRAYGIVAGEVDRSNTCAITLVDLKEDANPAIRGRLGPGGHCNVGIAGLGVGGLDGLDVVGNTGLGVNPALGHIDHCRKLIVIEAAVAVEPDCRDLGPLSHLGLRRRDTHNQRSTSDERRKGEKRHG